MVATLWPVNDRSTAVLVAEFYRLLLAERQDPATALRGACGHLRDATARDLAQRFERRYDDSGGTDLAAYEATADLRSRPDPALRPYADPVYWAGFVYFGPVLAENVVLTGQAACWYSWMTPPTRSRRRTRKASRSVTSAGSGLSGAALDRAI